MPLVQNSFIVQIAVSRVETYNMQSVPHGFIFNKGLAYYCFSLVELNMCVDFVLQMCHLNLQFHCVHACICTCITAPIIQLNMSHDTTFLTYIWATNFALL